MHHFFAKPSQILEKEIWLEGSDVNHIKNVLRMGEGDRLTVSGGNDNRLYTCRITSVEKDKIWAAIERVEEKGSELLSRIFLFQGLPKGDKMEWIVQKAVELGVHEVIPVVTKRTIVKLDAAKEKSRRARWNAIAEAAAKQSGRMAVPQVVQQMSFAQALEYAKDLDVKLIPFELAKGMQRTRELLYEIKPGQSIGILIGPEGGFEETEVQEAEAAGFARITLGERILRTETAGLATLAVLGFLLE